MAAALNFPSSLTLSLSLSFHKPCLSFRHEHRPKILFTTERFSVRAAASHKSRSGRKVMSNVELLDEIKQFLYSVGLPEDHVPSTKELSLHGRNDLANIVRRRGYKLIGELLAESKNLQADGFNVHKIQKQMLLAASETKEALEGQDEKMDNLAEQMCLSNGISAKENLSANFDVDSSPPSDGNSLSNEDLSAVMTLEDISQSEDSILRDIQSVTDESIREEDFGDYQKTKEITSDNGTSVPAETSENLVFEVEEASSLGLVDNSESSSGGMPSSDDNSLGESINENLVVEVEEASTLDVVNNLCSTSIDMPSSADASLGDIYSSLPSSNSIVNADDSDTSFEHYSSSSLEEKVANFMENGYLDPIEGIINHSGDEEQGLINVEFTKNENKIDLPLDTSDEMQLENLDGSENSLTLNQITATKLENTLGANNNSDGQLVDADLDMALDAKVSLDMVSEMQLNNQEGLAEISHLKQMLHQKELELSRLKELIVQEKLALTALQERAEGEISKALKLILEKDAELQAAEESLSGLVEVEIQYSGEGEIVEVTGSFNGWEHRIKMDPEELPSRKSKHWSTTLWLYPGTYEIKFIIDGQWKIDPQKETMSKGGITNNILRVSPTVELNVQQ